MSQCHAEVILLHFTILQPLNKTDNKVCVHSSSGLHFALENIRHWHLHHQQCDHCAS